jgi:hypothetical protein
MEPDDKLFKMPVVTVEQVIRFREAAFARINELEMICAEAYQVVGTLLDDCGRFGDEDGDKILDNLSQHRMIHQDVLPFASKRG